MFAPPPHPNPQHVPTALYCNLITTSDLRSHIGILYIYTKVSE